MNKQYELIAREVIYDLSDENKNLLDHLIHLTYSEYSYIAISYRL